MFWLTVVAVAISLIPGALSWLTGLRLMRLRDDPALPERVQARQVLIGRIVIIAGVSLIVLPGSPAWSVLLLVLSLMLGEFPVRRRVFEEQWGLGAYLLFLVCLAAAFWGFWLFLGLSPNLVQHAGPWRWVVASVVAAALLAWTIFHPAVFVWLMRGRPFSSPPLFDRVIRLTRIRPPLLVRLVDPGGRFATGFALASLWRPTVAFTSTFFTVLTPEEQAAVYAHEVAHLEEATRARLWRAELSQASAILIGTFVPAAFPAFPRVMLAVWGLMIFLWLSYLYARSRAREERSDRRAVELCGDSEAMVRALVKLHSYARLPRRWDIDVEREATHPSQARRIQAIRRLAGHTAPPEVAVAFPLRRPGGFVIFARDRIARLEGVASGTPADPDVLRAQASRTQEIPYGDLIELRISAALWSPPKIVATDKMGRVWTLPVRPGDLASIQAVLDRADLHLAPLPQPHRFELLLVRIFPGGFLFFVTWAPHPGEVIIANVCLTILLPVPTSLAMLTAASAAHAFAVLTSRPDARHAAIAAALIVVALAVMWETRRLVRRAVYRSKVASVVLPLVLGGVFLVVAWAWTYADSEYFLAFDWHLLGLAIAFHPDAWIAAVSLAGGLLSRRNGWARLAAFLAFICATVLVFIAKGRVI